MGERGRRVMDRAVGQQEEREQCSVLTSHTSGLPKALRLGVLCKSLSQGHHVPAWVILPTPCPMLLLSRWVLALPTRVLPMVAGGDLPEALEVSVADVLVAEAP